MQWARMESVIVLMVKIMITTVRIMVIMIIILLMITQMIITVVLIATGMPLSVCIKAVDGGRYRYILTLILTPVLPV